MSDSEPPPSSGPSEGTSDSVPPSPRTKDSRRKRLEGVIPEIIKRAVELGVEKARESPENLKSFVNDMKVPKEIAHYIFAQVDETKNGLFRVVANEIRDFLDETNFAGEVQKLLTTVQFEVNTTIRFTPNDGKKKKTSKKSKGGDDKAANDDQEDELLYEAGADEEDDDSEGSSLPKPEVKSSVYVTRDERRKRGKTD